VLRPTRKSEFPGRIHAAASRKSVIRSSLGAMPFFWRTMPALPRWHTTAVPQIAADLLQRPSRQSRASYGLMHRSNQHLHSITSSTRTNSVAGTSRSRALTVLRLIVSSYLVAPKLAGRPAFPNDDAIDVACLVPALVNLPFGPRVNVVVPRQNSQGTVIIILVHNRPSGDPTPSRADIEMTRSLWKSQSPWGSLYTTTSSSEKKDMRVSRG